MFILISAKKIICEALILYVSFSKLSHRIYI